MAQRSDSSADLPSPIRTHDLDLAAYLLAEGADLIAVEGVAGAGHEFLIDGAGVPDRVEAYVRGQAVVALDRFLSARNGLLDRLHRPLRVRR